MRNQDNDRSVKMSEQISINIAGVCVLRDTFGLHKNDGGYKIKKYSSSFAPLYIKDEPYDMDYEKYLNVTVGIYPNFTRRNVFMDITKKSMGWVLDEKSDYILVDVGLLRTDYIQLYNGQLYYGGYKSIFETLDKEGMIPKISGIKPFDFMPDEELRNRLQEYFSKILEVYPVDKIILVEVKNVFEKVNLDNYLMSNFQDSTTVKAKNQNIWLDKCFKYSKEILKGCHIIYFPENVLGDENHHLKPAPMHYTQEYYDYALKAIDIICREKLSSDEEMKRLENLRSSYSEKYKMLREQMIMSSPQMQNWIKKKNNGHRYARNAMNFCFEVMMDTLDKKSIFLPFVLSLRGKNIAVLASSCKAGDIFKKAALTYGVNIIFLSNKSKLQLLTDEEFTKVQQSDFVISCNVHDTKTHVLKGVKCVDIWDILHDKSLTDNLPPFSLNNIKDSNIE